MVRKGSSVRVRHWAPSESPAQAGFSCAGRRHRCPLAAAVEAFGSVARPPARARSRKRTISPRYLLDTERGSERSVGPDNGPEWMRERGVGVDLAPAVLPSASLGPG